MLFRNIKTTMKRHDNLLLLLCIILFLFYISRKYDLVSTDVKANKPQPQSNQQPPEDLEEEHRSVCVVPPLQTRQQFYDYFKKIEYRCQRRKDFGINSGAKVVCLDKAVHLNPSDCHVLSFGINNEWSFDDSIANYGCKVYSFDPTMGKEDHQRSEKVQFFKLGISNITGQRRVGMGGHFGFFNVDRYGKILERLGLSNKTIDYLKLDVELSELDFFQDVLRNTPHLLKNIRQLAVELHHGHRGEGLNKKKRFSEVEALGPKSTLPIFWQYTHELRCYGFKLFHTLKTGPWTETVWVRL